MLNDEINNNLKNIFNIFIIIGEMFIVYLLWGLFISFIWNNFLVNLCPIQKITMPLAIIFTIFVRTLTNHTPSEVALFFSKQPRTFKSFLIQTLRPLIGLLLCFIASLFI